MRPGASSGVVDLLFSAQRLIIDVDGNAGFRVLRVTWDDLTQRPEAIIAEIRLALAC